MDGAGERNPLATLTSDLAVEILRHLPIKSLCRSKCVSKSWRGLISHPDHRKKLPQTQSGFFYLSFSGGADHFSGRVLRFASAWRADGPPLIDPSSLSFPPGYESIHRLDCCSGLLLFRCCKISPPHGFNYVVCNPATEEWVALPDSAYAGTGCTARLAFDPAASSHFHVFEFVSNEDGYTSGVEIYPSETGAWTHKEVGWDGRTTLRDESSTVFFNGMLHLAPIESAIVAVDREGKAGGPFLSRTTRILVSSAPSLVSSVNLGGSCFSSIMRNMIPSNYPSGLLRTMAVKSGS